MWGAVYYFSLEALFVSISCSVCWLIFANHFSVNQSHSLQTRSVWGAFLVLLVPHLQRFWITLFRFSLSMIIKNKKKKVVTHFTSQHKHVLDSNTKTVWMRHVFGHTFGQLACLTFLAQQNSLQNGVRCKSKGFEWSCRYFVPQWHHLFLIVLVIYHSNAFKVDFYFTFRRKQASTCNPDVGFPCCYASI